MLTSLEGVQGTGKTTMAVALAYDEWKKNGTKVISNLHLNFPYTHFNIEWFLENLTTHEMEDCTLILDEMYQIADSRSSATKLNKLMTYFIVQTRKRGVDVYLCTHHIGNIDLRVRRALDIRGACRYYGEDPCKRCRGTGEFKGAPCDRCKGYGKTGLIRGVFLDKRIRKRYVVEIFAPNYWHLFDTRERIPLQAKILQGIDTLEVV